MAAMMPMERHDVRTDSGFTLIEVLVSIAVLVVAVSVLQTGFGGGWRTMRAADQEWQALMIAKSRLAASGIETPLEAGTSASDVAGQYRWRVIVEPVAGNVADADAALPKGFWTIAEVRWNDGRAASERQIRLKTFKLRRAARAEPP
ncbi:MAG: prepilin-type N-terminal cleavage/methylation domain-containing protein [Hyphomicrobium sp.]